MNADPIIEKTGGCGCFQVLIVSASFSCLVVGMSGQLMMMFGNYDPGWVCEDTPKDLDSQIASFSLNNRSLFNNGSLLTNKLTEGSHDVGEYNYATDQNAQNSTNSAWKKGLCETNGSACNNIVFRGESKTIVTEFALICGKSWIPSLIISIQMVGVFVGSYVGGQLGDRYGRRIALYFNSTVFSLFHLIAVFSFAWQMFAICRFVIGFTIGGLFTIAFTYPFEYVNVRARGLIISVPSFNIGALLFAVEAMLLRDWKHLHIVGAVLGALVTLPAIWVPESLRWLTVKGEMRKANKVVEKIAHVNRSPVPDTTILYDIAREAKRSNQDRAYTYLDLFKTPQMRLYSVCTGLKWIVVCMIFYAITFGVKALFGDFFINMIIVTLVDIPGSIIVGPLINKFGRKSTCLLSAVATGLCCILVVVVNFVAAGNVKGMAITVLAFSAKFAANAFWLAETVFVTELYPTVVRNLGQGYANCAARIGGIIAPYLIPSNPELLYVCYLVMGILSFVLVALSLPLPETKGKQLSETILDPKELEVLGVEDNTLDSFTKNGHK